MESNYSRRVLDELDRGSDEVAATAFIAIVCYPFDQAGTDRYWKAQTAFVAKRLRDERQEYVADDARRMKSREMRSALEKTRRVLYDKRLRAATDIAMPVLMDKLGKRFSGHLQIRGLPSIYAASGVIAGANHHQRVSSFEADRKNIQRRLWGDSLPVIHLAYAMATTVNWKAINRPSLQRLIWSPQWVRPALEQADRLLALLVSADLIGASDDMVRLDY